MVGNVIKLPVKIHKNSKLEKYRNFEIAEENGRLSRTLSNMQCGIKPYQKTEK